MQVDIRQSPNSPWQSASINAGDWQLECDPITFTGHVICLTEDRFFSITHCKPGGNRVDYRFTLISGAVTPSEITTRVECESQLTVSNITNPVWTSISPGTEGQYNNLLSCTNCYNPIFTPTSLEPSEIVYRVTGTVPAVLCSQGFDYNLVTVHVKPELIADLNITPLNVCENDVPEITAIVTPASDFYTYEWFNAYDAGGTRVGTGPTYTPTSEGPYSVRVTDTQGGTTCDVIIHNFDVTFDEDPPVLSFSEFSNLTVSCSNPTSANQEIAQWLNDVTATDDGGSTFRPVTHNYGQAGCGLPAVGPIQFECGEVITVTFCAEDICGNVGTTTGTISILSQDFSVPPNGGSIISCPSQGLVQPTPPVVFDACGNPITPELFSTPTTIDCEGIMEWVFNYGDCNNYSHHWTYTYTVEREPFTVPADQGTTVACEANAEVPNALLPTVTD
ncbi:hypothetical protein EG832_10070, partial [bacterium]|nr:hypothetical protein [bacterium]